MLKAIIFDADGTLYNIKTKRAYSLAADFLSEKIGIPAKEINSEWKKIIDGIKSSSEDSLNPKKRAREYALKKLLLKFGVKNKNIDPLVGKTLKIFWSVALEDLEIFPEIAKTLKALSKDYALAVASEEFKANLIKKLNRAFGDWKKYFKILITPETTGTMKPSEKYCEAARQKLKLGADEILAVGDSDERDLGPAKKIGFKTLKVLPCKFAKLIRPSLEKK